MVRSRHLTPTGMTTRSVFMELAVIVASFFVLNVPYIELHCHITSIHFLRIIYHNYVKFSFITSPGPSELSSYF